MVKSRSGRSTNGHALPRIARPRRLFGVSNGCPRQEEMRDLLQLVLIRVSLSTEKQLGVECSTHDPWGVIRRIDPEHRPTTSASRALSYRTAHSNMKGNLTVCVRKHVQYCLVAVTAQW